MKLRPLTQEAVTPKKTVKNSKKPNHTNLQLDLGTTISDNYKGTSDSIAGILNDIPKQLKSVFINSTIKTLVARQGYFMYILDNQFTIFVKEVTVKNKIKRHLKIKHKNKYVFDSVLDLN